MDRHGPRFGMGGGPMRMRGAPRGMGRGGMGMFRGGGGRDRENMEATNKLFVGNLPQETSPAKLKELFGAFGSVSECDVISNYAFVHFANINDAKKAIQGLHQSDLGGNKIRVEFSQSKSRPRGGGGGMREGVTCFKCGAPGHMANECRGPRGPQGAPFRPPGPRPDFPPPLMGGGGPMMPPRGPPGMGVPRQGMPPGGPPFMDARGDRMAGPRGPAQNGVGAQRYKPYSRPPTQQPPTATPPVAPLHGITPSAIPGYPGVSTGLPPPAVANTYTPAVQASDPYAAVAQAPSVSAPTPQPAVANPYAPTAAATPATSTSLADPFTAAAAAAAASPSDPYGAAAAAYQQAVAALAAAAGGTTQASAVPAGVPPVQQAAPTAVGQPGLAATALAAAAVPSAVPGVHQATGGLAGVGSLPGQVPSAVPGALPGAASAVGASGLPGVGQLGQPGAGGAASLAGAAQLAAYGQALHTAQGAYTDAATQEYYKSVAGVLAQQHTPAVSAASQLAAHSLAGASLTAGAPLTSLPGAQLGAAGLPNPAAYGQDPSAAAALAAAAGVNPYQAYQS